MLSAAAKTAITIGVIVFDQVSVLDIASPAVYLEQLPQFADTPVEFYSVATKPGPIQSSKYVPIYVTDTYAESHTPFDILIVPGAPATKELVKDQAVMDSIRKLADEATDVLTICTGGRLTAATGLLDGKRATTNKMNFEDISTANPDVEWIQHARWVEDGKWWTSSGVVSGVDMANAYVASRFGADVAEKISAKIEYRPIMDWDHDPFAPKQEGCKTKESK